MKRTAINVLSVVLAFVPLILGLIAVAFLLPESVPMHWGTNGEVTRMGGMGEELVLSIILFVCNLFCALCCIFVEPAMAAGLVHGVKSPTTARYVLLGCIILIDVIFVVILAMQGAFV